MQAITYSNSYNTYVLLRQGLSQADFIVDIGNGSVVVPSEVSFGNVLWALQWRTFYFETFCFCPTYLSFSAGNESKGLVATHMTFPIAAKACPLGSFLLWLPKRSGFADLSIARWWFWCCWFTHGRLDKVSKTSSAYVQAMFVHWICVSSDWSSTHPLPKFQTQNYF